MNNFVTQKNRGAALLIFVLLFLGASLSFMLTVGKSVYDDLVTYKTLKTGKESFFAAEGAIEDAIYRHRATMDYDATETYSLFGVSVDVARTITGDTYEIIATGDAGGATRRSEIIFEIGSGASFGFGLQSGNGGISLANSASVHGNVFSNGQVTGSGNMVYGDIISASSTGLVNGIHATGTVRAHTITNSTIDMDAYYQSIDNNSTASGSLCTVSNTHCHPGSTDELPRSMPIDEALIEEWKTAAEDGGVLPLSSCSGGTAAGTYTIDTTQTIGPLKIPCNFSVEKTSTVLTIAGPIWVEGNITTANGPTLQADPGFVDEGAVVIADNESNRTSSSKISIQGSTGYMGASGDSYVLMLSMNNDSENGGANIAIDVDNNTPNSEREVIYYAPHGKLVGRNSLLLRGATAHQISLLQTASVYYETGMASPSFPGTGGGYVISSWKEVE